MAAHRSMNSAVGRKYLEYARNCRYPVVFLLIDIRREQAWYLWLQQWVIERALPALARSSRFSKTFRAALATHAQNVLGPLIELLEKVAPFLPGAALDEVIEQAHFDTKDPRVAYYCPLREAYPATTGFAWMTVPVDFRHASSPRSGNRTPHRSMDTARLASSVKECLRALPYLAFSSRRHATCATACD
jgi:hypothetical protein